MLYSGRFIESVDQTMTHKDNVSPGCVGSATGAAVSVIIGSAFSNALYLFQESFECECDSLFHHAIIHY